MGRGDRCVRTAESEQPLGWLQGYHKRDLLHCMSSQRLVPPRNDCLPRVRIDGDEGRKRCHLASCLGTMRGDGDKGRFHEAEGLRLRMVRFCRSLPWPILRELVWSFVTVGFQRNKYWITYVCHLSGNHGFYLADMSLSCGYFLWRPTHLFNNSRSITWSIDECFNVCVY